MNLNIKQFKLPSKEVEVKIIDQIKSVTINPISGFGLTKLQKMSEDLQADPNNFDLQEKLVRLAIKFGCKADDETINFLVENDLFACMKITQAVLLFSGQYNSAKLDQAKIAKKKQKN